MVMYCSIDVTSRPFACRSPITRMLRGVRGRRQNWLVSSREGFDSMPIPSFYPVHDAIRTSRSRRSTQTNSLLVDYRSGLRQMTLGQILADGRDFRYIDNPHIKYSDILAGENSNVNYSPFTKDGLPKDFYYYNVDESRLRPMRVGVIGGGLSGLLTSFQLAKAGMDVEVFEVGPPPYDETDSAEPIKGAGRIKPTYVIPGNSDSLMELGAMRFPVRGHLFWHYIRQVYDGDESKVFTAFPNPGKVPTIYTGLGTAHALWDYGDLGLSGDIEALNTRHIVAFTDYSPSGSSLTASQVSIILNNASLTQSQLEDVESFWNATISDLYNKTYREFLVEKGFNSDEIEIIGYTGFGTGGFAPLFETSVLDVLRLVIWNYADEFSVPELWKLPEKLRELGAANGVTFNYNKKVEAIYYSSDHNCYDLLIEGESKASGYYPNVNRRQQFDYLVLAMSHPAAQRLLAESEGVTKGNAYYGSYIRSEAPVYPFYDTFKNRTSSIRTELETQQGMKALKSFHSIYGPPGSSAPYDAQWTTISPQIGSDADDAPWADNNIRVIFGEIRSNVSVKTGTTYALPSSGAPYPTIAYRSLIYALHYSWGNDAAGVYDALLPELDLSGSGVVNDLGSLGVGRLAAQSVEGEVAAETMGAWSVGSRNSGFYPSPPINEDPKNFQRGLMGLRRGISVHDHPSSSHSSKHSLERAASIVYWPNVPYVWTGFKLDAPATGAKLVYAYKVMAQGAALNSTDLWDASTRSGENPRYTVAKETKNLFFAGCSFSHYGGWVEGAFQSALATTAGIIWSAAKKQGTLISNTDPQDIVNYEVIDAFINKSPDPYTY